MGRGPCAGTVSAMVGRAAEMLRPTTELVRDLIRDEEVAHFDETGVRADGRLRWVHSSSTERLTYQTVSDRRGKEGMDENGMLPHFSGIAQSDCWRPYWRYAVDHAVCGSHLLRNLQGVIDRQPGHLWPRAFSRLLLEMKASAESNGGKVEDSLMRTYGEEYDLVIEAADAECPRPPREPGKRGRRKLGKERALIERLVALRDAATLFARDPRVSFDNNLALCPSAT